MRALIVLAGISLGTAVALTSPSVQARPAALTVDRTFVCVPAFVGGVRKIETRAHSGSGRRRTGWDSPSFAAVSTTAAAAAAIAIENELGWVVGGRPSPAAAIRSTGFGTFPVRTWGTVAVNRRLCRASTARIAFRREGLRGGVAGPLDERYDCVTPRRVFLRVRAALESQGALRAYRSFLRTTIPVTAATLTVQTPSGRLLVHAEVSSSGKARLFTLRSCLRD